MFYNKQIILPHNGMTRSRQDGSLCAIYSLLVIEENRDIIYNLNN